MTQRSPRISVCITTYNRPALLREALASCSAQRRLPDEIVIGDDSPDDETLRLIHEYAQTVPFPITYKHHRPALGQNANVNDVFLRATGTHVVLLHDDDLLLPSALATLIDCWTRYPTLAGAFGKQLFVTHDGAVLPERSAAFNRKYSRTSDQSGLITRSWNVGLSQQLPNDGYMLRTEIAQQMLWRQKSEVGNGGDFDFGLRLGMLGLPFFFVDSFISKYRVTETGSVSGSADDDCAIQSYMIAKEATLPPEAEAARRDALLRFSRPAIGQAIQLGERRLGWQIYVSQYHPWLMRLSPGGIRRFLYLALPWPMKAKRARG